MHNFSIMKVEKIILIISLLSAGLLLSASDLTIIQAERSESSEIFLTRENIIFNEDFETGLDLWSTNDITDPGSFWYTSTFNAQGGSGKSWRMADENFTPNGGYDNSWYQVLDTPVITLPSTGDLTITFDQYRAIEEPGDNGEFDGWDGLNVRIRNADADYNEAEILTNCTPEYNSSSLYSFGFEHNEDPDGIPGIPGWGGSADWITTSIVIPSSYAGTDVIISFAFASDPNTSTVSNPEFTGIFIDNIQVAEVFTNDGEDETGFNGFSNTPKGGDLWHITQDPEAPSPVNALGCFDPETFLYNPNMHNYVTSGDIDLPAESNIYFDMKVKTDLDEYAYPDCDYFSVEVRYVAAIYINPPIVIWSNWNSISNPLGDSGIENVVFTGSVENWSYFSANWSGYNDLSELADETIQIRIGLHSNENELTGFGIMIDDITLSDTTYTHSVNNEVPNNLASMYNYPNPFNPSTKINLNIQEEADYSLKIYNAKGQHVKTLINSQLSAGIQEVIWNGTDNKNKDVSSGIYLYILEANGRRINSKKMLLLK